MNVPLHQEERKCWETTLSTVLNREETLEMIVPDACPDIQDIVDTDGCLQLRNKDCAEGCISLGGVVPCSILYQPEGGGALCQLKAEVPFQFTAELEGAEASSQCVVRPQLTLAETRAINPRKVLIRVGFHFEITLCRPTIQRCVSEILDRELLGIEQRKEQQSGSFLTYVGQRSFPVSDMAQLPGSRPALRELLRSRCRAYVSESRLTGGKVILKGGIALKLLYLDREEEVCSAELEIPFSQIIDVGGASDTASFQLFVVLTDCQIEPEDEEGRELSVELELLAQILVREEQVFPLVTDAYSIRNPGTPEFTVCLLPKLLEQTVRRQTIREIVETPTMAQEVCDARAYPGQVRLMNGELVAEVRLHGLYVTESGGYASVMRQIQVKCPVEVPEGVVCLAWCEVAELDAAASSGGVEFRIGVDFHWTLLEQKRIDCISAFQMEADETRHQEHQPSVVLRQVTAGESLWDVAKSYLTTREEIRMANELEGDKVEEGQLLLIPRKR